MTSHDVVACLRRILGERRIGHAGTLDPAATGVLVLGVGQATRLLGVLTLDEKRYLARIRFGAETTTDDAEGEVRMQAPVPPFVLDPDYARERVERLVGARDQVPPAYSAISVGGVRSYARARRGEDPELPSRHVTIHEALLIGVTDDDGPCWDVALTVSKGTYVRSIARDLGRELGCGAHLASLRRLAAGAVTVGECLELDDARQGGLSAVRSHLLDPARLLGVPVRNLDTRELALAMNGRSLKAGGQVLQEGGRVALVHGGLMVGLWKRRGDELVCELNFPKGIEGVRI